RFGRAGEGRARGQIPVPVDVEPAVGVEAEVLIVQRRRTVVEAEGAIGAEIEHVIVPVRLDLQRGKDRLVGRACLLRLRGKGVGVVADANIQGRKKSEGPQGNAQFAVGRYSV